MTPEQKQAQKRIDEIWDELEPTISGTGASSLIEELIELELLLESQSNI